MPPKKKAASKSKKAEAVEPIPIDDNMSHITVRRPLKSKKYYLKRCTKFTIGTFFFHDILCFFL